MPDFGLPRGKYLSERILITGGRGFVGGYLSALLNRSRPGWAVSAPGMVSPENLPHLDITDTANLYSFIGDFRPTVIVHLAAIAAVTDAAKSPRHSWDINLGGTMNLTGVMRRVVPECRLLFVSSAEVYGSSHFREGQHDETMLLQPTNAYAASKAAADIHVRQQVFEGLNAIVVRPFNHTGPGQSDKFAIPSFASQIAMIEHGLQPARLDVGSLDDERDILDVGDVIDSYNIILGRRDLAPGSTFNLASGESRRIGDLLEILLSKSKVPIVVNSDASRLRREGVTRIVGNSALARKTLNWMPQRSIDETVIEILDFERRRYSKST